MKFIKTFPHAANQADCQNMIDYFDRCTANGMAMSRKDLSGHAKHLKDDTMVQLESFEQLHMGVTSETYSELTDIVWSCWKQYAEEFSILAEAKVQCPHLWVQRNGKGGGYHMWHYEDATAELSPRLATFILYLNDLGVDDGGETEFLYQHLRVRPKAGTLVMFPAGYTHTHRGNPVMGDEAKYIVTGWIQHITSVPPK